MIVNIQILRAVAALMVVCDHILFDWHHSHGNTFPYLFNTTVGSAGVDLFFVISGFIMLETTRRGDTNPASFLAKRLIRIAPLYWLLVMILAARSYEHDPSHFDWEWLVQSLLFLPHIEGGMAGARFPSSYFPILFVGWTLTFEMFFYAIFAIALVFRGSRYWPLVVPAFFLAMISLAGWAHYRYLSYYDHPIIFEFLFGMAIASIPPGFLYRPLESVGMATFMVIGGIAGLILGDLVFGEIRSARVLMYGIPAAAIVYGATRLEHSGYAVRNRLLLTIGAASYSLYLIHPIVLEKVERLLDIFPPQRFLAALAIYLCAMIVTVIFALLSYTYFERPTQRFLKRVLSASPVHGIIRPLRES